MNKFQISIDSKQRIEPIATQCSVRELRPLTANGKHSYYAVTAAIRGRDLRRRTPVHFYACRLPGKHGRLASARLAIVSNRL